MNYARIVFLENTFGNTEGEVVKVLHETDEHVYYNDGFRRYCYMEKSEEGTAYRYVPKGERLNKKTHS